MRRISTNTSNSSNRKKWNICLLRQITTNHWDFSAKTASHCTRLSLRMEMRRHRMLSTGFWRFTTIQRKNLMNLLQLHAKGATGEHQHLQQSQWLSTVTLHCRHWTCWGNTTRDLSLNDRSNLFWTITRIRPEDAVAFNSCAVFCYLLNEVLKKCFCLCL